MQVNLERAVSGDVRFGGHFVQGHVDTIASIIDRRPDGSSVVLRFGPRDREVMKYVVEKGYVTIDGASLTVIAVGGGSEEGEREGQGLWWEVMLVEYTQEKIITARKQVGEEVNVEVDITGKYIEVCNYFLIGVDGWVLANAVYIGDCRSRFLPTWALEMGKQGVACWRGWWRGLLRESWRRGNSIIALLRGRYYYCFMEVLCIIRG